MNKKLRNIILLTAILLSFYSCTTPWSETYLLTRFANKNLKVGSTLDEVGKLLEDNGYVYWINDNLPAQYLRNNRLMSASKEKKSLIWGRYRLKIDLYFDQQSNKLVEFDTLVFLDDLL